MDDFLKDPTVRAAVGVIAARVLQAVESYSDQTPAPITADMPGATVPPLPTASNVVSIAPATAPINDVTKTHLDPTGIPWDARIHASTKTCIKSGNWKKLKGVDAGTLEMIEAELHAAQTPATVAAPPATVAAPPATVAAPPAPPATVAAPPAPPAPPATVAAPALNPDVVFLTEKFGNVIAASLAFTPGTLDTWGVQGLTADPAQNINALLVHYGVDNLDALPMAEQLTLDNLKLAVGYAWPTVQ